MQLIIDKSHQIIIRMIKNVFFETGNCADHLYFIIQIQNSIQHCQVAVEFLLYLIDIVISTSHLLRILSFKSKCLLDINLDILSKMGFILNQLTCSELTYL